jgi:sugar phosphate isomerase/epimerase
MKPNLQIAVVAAVMSADPREAVTASRAAGFGGIEFDAASPTLDLTQLSQSGRREFQQVLRSNDQQLAALRVDLGIKGFSLGADVDRLLARLLKIMETAKGLSATPMVCIDVGPVPEPAAQPKPAPRVTPQQAGLIIVPEPPPPPAQDSRPVPGPDPALTAQVDNAFREICALADRVGVTIAIRSDLATFAAIDRVLASAACPWLGVDLDPVAMLRDRWGKDEIFSGFGSLIRNVRARDAVVGTDHRTKPTVIGKGSVNWPELFADLDAASFKGWLTIDSMELTDRRGGAIAGLGFIQTSVP